MMPKDASLIPPPCAAKLVITMPKVYGGLAKMLEQRIGNWPRLMGQLGMRLKRPSRANNKINKLSGGLKVKKSRIGKLRDRIEKLKLERTKLRDRIEELKLGRTKQRSTIIRLRERLKSFNETRKNSWLSSYLFNREKYWKNLSDHCSSYKSESVSLILAHDFMSLLPGLRLRERLFPHAAVIFDNVEAPLQQNRTSAKISNYFMENTADRLVANEEVRILSSQADWIFGTSPTHINFFKEIIPDRVSLVPSTKPFFEVLRSNQIREDCQLSENDHLILYLNNVYRNAGFEECAAALAELPENYKLAVLGKIVDPESHEAFENLRQQDGMQERLIQLPLVAPGEVINYISGCDCIAIPLMSSHPGYRGLWPNRLFQAIAACRPVVVADDTASAELVRQYEVGSVFKDTQPTSVASAFKEAIALGETPTFSSIIEHAAKEFCWEKNDVIIRKAVSKVCASKTGRALILSGKPIALSDRVASYARTLQGCGFSVEVISPSEPDESIRVNGVAYATLS